MPKSTMTPNLKRRQWLLSTTALASAVWVVGCATPNHMQADSGNTVDAGWPFYNGELSSQRFSNLKQITPANVATLQQVGRFQTQFVGRFAIGPVVHGDTLYGIAGNESFAVDARNGQLRWQVEHTPTGKAAGIPPRGLAYADGKIFRGTSDGHLVALDAQTGKTVWDVKAVTYDEGEYFVAAPVVWQGLVLIGNAGSDLAAVGHVMAFDASTGERRWTFDTVPTHGLAAETWPQDASKRRAGGGMYASFSLDERSGLLYVPVGNPGPDFAGGYRPGDNLYTCSVIMLDAKTGTLKGYRQITPHDVHDWDVAAAPVLFTSKAGQDIVAVGSKDGYVYGLDRTLSKQIYKTAVTRIENVDAPITPEGTHFAPGTLGGVNYNGPAYDPALNALFVNTIDWGTTVRLGGPESLVAVPGKPFVGSANVWGTPDKARSGWTMALDADSGKVLWRREAHTPMAAAVLPTAGGVLFTADTHGKLLALESATGKLLWSQSLGDPAAGGVITYSVAGKQYLAVAVGLTNPTMQTQSGPGFIAIYALP